MKTKKFLLIAVVFSLLTGFSSCKNNDPESLLIGTWKFSKVEIDISTSEPALDELIKTMLSMSFDMGTGATMTFNDNGTYNSTYINEGGKPETDNGTYSVKGKDQLTMDNEDAFTYKVTKNELRLSQDMKKEIEEEMGEYLEGITINKLIATVVCTK